MGIFTLAIGRSSSIQDSSIGQFSLPSGGLVQRDSLDELKRISPEKLEVIFGRDGIGFNMCVTLTEMIMAGIPRIENMFEYENENIKNYYVNLFNNIGNVGEPITLEEIWDYLWLNLMIHGNAFVQNIWDKKKQLNDFALIDPKRVDYFKDSSNKVVVDKETNQPIGYVIKKDLADQTIGDKIPEKYEREGMLKQNSYFLFAERITHFKINTIGDRLWGIGILEPAYTSVIRKLNMEEGQANSTLKSGFNPMIGYVGNDRKVATPKDLDWVGGLLKDLDVNKIGAFPNWVKIDTVKYDQSPLISAILEYQRENQISPAGLPMAIASGKADTTNKSTLGIHLQLNQFKLQRIMKRTFATFEKYILKKIAFYNKVKGVPKIKWGRVGPQDKEKLVDRILNATEKGIFLVEEVRDRLAEELNITLKNDLYEKRKKELEKNKKSFEEKENNFEEKNKEKK